MGNNRMTQFFRGNTDRLEWIHKSYEKDEIESILKFYSQQMVTVIANELGETKTKYEEGSEFDTDENAEKTMIAVVDELADRTKWELRNRIALSKMENRNETNSS